MVKWTTPDPYLGVVEVIQNYALALSFVKKKLIDIFRTY